MATTQLQGQGHRTDKWLARYGSDLSGVTEPARSLLDARLAAARRARWPLAVAAVVAVPVFAWGSFALFSDAPGGHGTFGRCFVAAVVVLQLAGLSAQALAHRADARIAAGLSRRVARGAHLTLIDVLGRRALVASTISFALALGWCTTLFAWGAVRVATALTIWFLLAGTATAWSVRAAVTRPTVACDAYSLTIDERLRSQEALRSVGVLTSLWISAAMATQDSAVQLPEFAPTGIWATVVLTSWIQVVALAPRRWPAPRSAAQPGPGPTPEGRPEP
jgi:hypothetical protein